MNTIYCLILFCLALLLSYLIRARGTGKSSRAILAICAGFVLLAIVWVTALESALRVFRYSNRILDLVPLHSVAAGIVVGVLVAGQPATSKPRARRPAKSGWWNTFFDAAHGSIQNIALATLIMVLTLLAVVPSTTWNTIFMRVNDLKAGSFELSLSPGSQSVTAQIREASDPLSAIGNTHLVQSRFVDDRLESLWLLVMPPTKAESQVILPGSGSKPEVGHDKDFEAIMAKPVQLRPLSSENDAGLDDQASASGSTLIEKDRAMFRKLGVARLSRKELETDVGDYAAEQERFLYSIRSHIACLRYVTSITGDNQLIDYNGFHIVEQLFGIAGTWTSVERIISLDYLKSNPQPTSVYVSSTRIKLLQAGLFKDMQAFSAWGSNLAATRAGQGRNAQALAILSETCQPLPAPVTYSTPAQRGLAYAPYITIFTAHLLAAVGDNRAAVKLLIDWYHGLDEVVAAMPLSRQRLLRPMISWIKLRVIYESYVIQKQSEKTADAVPVETALLQFMVFRLFEDVNAGLPIEDFFASSVSSCKAQDHLWMQWLILSYVTTIKDYLDLKNDRRDVTPLDDADWGLVARLEHINLECLRDALPGEDYAAQRVQFAVTIAEAMRNWYGHSGSEGDPSSRANIHSALVRLREALARFQHEQSGGGSQVNDDIESLVFPKNSLFDTALRVLRSLERFDRQNAVIEH